MPRLLIYLGQRENARLLADWLSGQYRVSVADSADDLNQPFDLLILDSLALDHAQQAITARRSAEGSLFLPFLLVTSRQDTGPHTRDLWQSIDDFIGLPVDKPELHARIRMLLRARRQSVELERRNEDLEALAEALGHDLRAPVRIAGSFSEAMLANEDEPLGEHNRRYAGRIRAAVRDMETLIDSLLTLAKLGRAGVRLRAVEPEPILQSLLRSLEGEIQVRAARVRWKDSLPAVQADTVLLKIALMNLITNALKFAAPGVPPDVSLFAAQSGDFCRLCVQDNGIGIPQEDQQRVFEPFVRLYGEEDYVGVGLGLPTVRKAVELMGGQVGVLSTPGAGSTFWIELPFAGSDGTGELSEVPPAPRAGGDG